MLCANVFASELCADNSGELPRITSPTPWAWCARVSLTTCSAPPTPPPVAPSQRPRHDTAPQDRGDPSPAGPPVTTNRPAPAQALAMGNRMASSVAQRNRTRPTSGKLPNTDRRTGPDRRKTENAGTSSPPTPTPWSVNIHDQGVGNQRSLGARLGDAVASPCAQDTRRRLGSWYV
jgi:hypothetical protein